MNFERIKCLCAENGITPTALCVEITGSKGNLATWKKGNIRPDYLLAIAKKFNVSMDYIFGLTEEKIAAPQGEAINNENENKIEKKDVLGKPISMKERAEAIKYLGHLDAVAAEYELYPSTLLDVTLMQDLEARKANVFSCMRKDLNDKMPNAIKAIKNAKDSNELALRKLNLLRLMEEYLKTHAVMHMFHLWDEEITLLKYLRELEGFDRIRMMGKIGDLISENIPSKQEAVNK